MDVFQFFNKKRVEVLLISAFVFLLLFVRIGQPWGHAIAHTYPQFFNANDNFLHAELSDYVKEEGNYAYAPSYFSGGYTDVVGYIPPLIHHLSAMLSHLTGLETYDTTYVVIMFLTCFGCLLVYFTIKKANETLAILSLPFMLGVFAFTFEIAHAWGLYIFITGSFFFFAFIWCMENFEKKYSFLLLALFLSGMAIGHTTELIFSIGFLVIYFAVRFFRNELKGVDVKNVFWGLLIAAAVSAYYLIIFYFTWIKTQPFTFSVMERPVFAPNLGVNLWDFGVTQFLLYAGLLFFVFMFLFKDDAEKLRLNPASAVVIAGLFMLLMGFTNYIGFGVRAFQTRIFWPVYLAVFMGMGLYFVPAYFKKWRLRYAYAAAFLLLLVFFYSHYNGLTGPGLVDQQAWDGFKWISENTPEDAAIYHFYSKPATQFDALFTSKRVPYAVNLNDYIEALKAGVIKTDYKSDNPALTDTQLPYRTSLLAYGYHAYEDAFRNQTIDMWNMDYYFFVIGDPYDSGNVIYTYNMYVKDYLQNQTWVDEAYSNGEVVILKNNEPGRKP